MLLELGSKGCKFACEKEQSSNSTQGMLAMHILGFGFLLCQVIIPPPGSVAQECVQEFTSDSIYNHWQSWKCLLFNLSLQARLIFKLAD